MFKYIVILFYLALITSGQANNKEKIVKNLKEIKVIEFDHTDVVRHPLVSKIIRAYQKKSTDDKN